MIEKARVDQVTISDHKVLLKEIQTTMALGHLLTAEAQFIMNKDLTTIKVIEGDTLPVAQEVHHSPALPRTVLFREARPPPNVITFGPRKMDGGNVSLRITPWNRVADQIPKAGEQEVNKSDERDKIDRNILVPDISDKVNKIRVYKNEWT